MRNYWTGEFLSGLPDEAIEVMVPLPPSKPSPLDSFFVLPGGGAARESRRHDGARPARGAVQLPRHVAVDGPADDEANIAWTRELSAAVKPFATGRVYVNFIGDEGEERVVASFGASGYARLQALKDRYDPGNRP